MTEKKGKLHPHLHLYIVYLRIINAVMFYIYIKKTLGNIFFFNYQINTEKDII